MWHSGRFTEVGDAVRFQRLQCIIFAPDKKVDSGGRLVVDVLHQYLEVMDMEESEDGILIHSQKDSLIGEIHLMRLSVSTI